MENISNLTVKRPFLGITKPQVEAKFVVKIPRDGTKEASVEMAHLCP